MRFSQLKIRNFRGIDSSPDYRPVRQKRGRTGRRHSGAPAHNQVYQFPENSGSSTGRIALFFFLFDIVAFALFAALAVFPGLAALLAAPVTLVASVFPADRIFPLAAVFLVVPVFPALVVLVAALTTASSGFSLLPVLAAFPFPLQKSSSFFRQR